MFIPAKPDPSPYRMVGNSAAIVSLRRLIEALAISSSAALICGESGTGKELVAQALHRQGPRADGPFVPLNCGAIPKELIESELFGHRKGSFTGAIADRLGRFELAHGGTLFLDEIGDLPMDMQVKLLRALQERCVLPVGATKEVPIDVRVIAATHRDLEAQVQTGRFREDLYYRLNVLPIQTTPLRERNEDVPLLLTHYAQRFALKGAGPIAFSHDLMGVFIQYGWPGNVRELSNLVDRFSTLFPGQELSLDRIPTCMLPSGLAQLQSAYLKEKWGLTEVPLSVLHAPEDKQGHWGIPLPEGAQWPPSESSQNSADAEDELSQLLSGLPVASTALSGQATPISIDGSPEASNDEINAVEQAIFLGQGIQSLPPEGISLKQHLIDIERSLIEQALARTNGNVSKTARLLQLQRTTLIEKINKYDLRSSG